MPGALTRYHAQGIDVYPVPLQQLQGGHTAAPGFPSLGIYTPGVVIFPIAVQREANQKAFPLEEGGPILGQKGAVGLNGKGEPYLRRLLGPGAGGKGLKKGEPCHCGLAALEGEGHRASGLRCLKGPVNELFRRGTVHPAHAGLLPVLGLVLIKAVPAPQIAGAGGGLDEKIHKSHVGILLIGSGWNCHRRGWASERRCSLCRRSLCFQSSA